jgi:hypothetical protein
MPEPTPLEVSAEPQPAENVKLSLYDLKDCTVEEL